MSQQEKLPPTQRKLLGIITIKYKLINRTGLLIRSPMNRIAIGGNDTETMITAKKYRTGSEELIVEVPFIPGSSIKGRMRSLLELLEGAELYYDGKIYIHKRDPTSDGACHDLDHALDDLFGSPSVQLQNLIKKQRKEKINEFIKKVAPTRLIVEDVFPSQEYIEQIYKTKNSISREDFLEEKSENRIDRITSAADPRFILRIRPGVMFEGVFNVLVFDTDVESKDDKSEKLGKYLDLLFRGMMLIEDTYLGGSGSRGYGKVSFKNISIELKTSDYYLGVSDPITIGELDNPRAYFKVKEEILEKILSSLNHQK